MLSGHHRLVMYLTTPSELTITLIFKSCISKVNFQTVQVKSFQEEVHVLSQVKSGRVCIALSKTKRFKRREVRTLSHGTCMEFAQSVVTTDPC